jgi:4-diphosphocytidyl-2-C-methyl-D-erythritol kinase
MREGSWPAPAKLNLFLHILGRREDGYHELQTVFQLLDLCDEISLEPHAKEDIILTRNYDSVPDTDDLVFRAASILRQQAGIRQGIKITVQKQIPMGGGLGGGSTDAATVLLALNEIWGCGFNIEQLAGIGLGLGADVPVFIHAHTAWAEGIGEKLEPVALPEDWYCVIHPGCHVSTAFVFKHPDLTRNTPPITIRDFMKGACHNDCESLVYREFPEIAEVSRWLGDFTAARLTGTGACVFGRFNTELEARDVLARIPDKWQGFVSRGTRESKVLQRLALERRERD